MKIVISGPPGSGKSTVAKILSEKFSLKYVSAGLIFREIASKQGISILELNKLAEKDFDIDKLIDKEIFRVINEEKNVIIESHIAGWLLKGLVDISIYLNASIHTRAKRISIRDNLSFNDALIQILKREESHAKRFLQYYGIDIYDLSPFDLVINTDFLDPQSIANIIELYITSKRK